jgi:hypothetical protein
VVGVDASGLGSSQIPVGVHCPMCGAASHPDAEFCAACGARLQPRGPSRAGQGRGHGRGGYVSAIAEAGAGAVVTPNRWEYADSAIETELYPLEDRFLEQYEEVVTQALSNWGAEGWEPAQSLEWRDVVANDRFVAALRAPRWWPFGALFGGRAVVTHVLVRLRRAG